MDTAEMIVMIFCWSLLASSLQSEADVDDDFSFLQPLDLITKDVYELRQIIKERKESIQKEREKNKDTDMECDREPERERGCEKERERQEKEREKQDKDKERERDRGKLEKDKERGKEKDKEKQHEEHTDKESGRECEDKVKDKHDENGVCRGNLSYLLFFFSWMVIFFALTCFIILKLI